MTIYQFVIVKANQASAPLKSYIAHQFGGKHVRMRLLKVHFDAIYNTFPAEYPGMPLRLDLVGMQTNTGTAFQNTACLVNLNPSGLKSNSVGLGIFICNKPHDTDFHGEVKIEGFCTGNFWELSLQFADLAPGYETTFNDIFECVLSCIVTVDVEEI